MLRHSFGKEKTAGEQSEQDTGVRSFSRRGAWDDGSSGGKCTRLSFPRIHGPASPDNLYKREYCLQALEIPVMKYRIYYSTRLPSISCYRVRGVQRPQFFETSRKRREEISNKIFHDSLLEDLGPVSGCAG